MIMAKATRGRIHGGLPLRGDGSPLHVHARAEEIFYDYLLLFVEKFLYTLNVVIFNF